MTTTPLLRVSLSRLPRPAGIGLCLSRGTQKHPDRQIGEHELFFVRRGTLPIAEAGRNCETRAGESLILWPHRRHYGTDILAEGAEFFWLHFVVPAPRRGDEIISVPQHARPARPERLMELLHRVLHDSQNALLTPVSGSLLVMLILHEITMPAPAAPPADAGLAARAEAALVRRFHLPIGTASIARTLGCNPDYLGRVYRRAYGRSIMTAVGDRRVIEAQRLLLANAGDSMEEIAGKCGFRNATWFRRLFKRATGTTPDAFRRSHARGHINS